jgi:hypothetical protein
LAKPISRLGPDIGRQKRDIVKQLEKLGRVSTRRAFATLVDATPVDTSKAVTNWRASRTVPLTDVAGPGVSSVKGSGASAARARAKDVAEPVIAGFGIGDTLYITNNVPYIGLLNDGSPRHRAANMLRKAQSEFIRTARSFKVVRQL